LINRVLPDDSKKQALYDVRADTLAFVYSEHKYRRD
jgi:hypothetical protein